MRLIGILGSVCLVPALARAAPDGARDEAPPKPKHELLERRLLLPSLVGFGSTATASLTTVAGGGVGYDTGAAGIVSYTRGTIFGAYSDTFSFNPSFDVRVGRFTLGSGVSLTYSRQNVNGAEETQTSFQLAPRVGYLVPLAAEVYLWPRASAGVLYAESSATGYSTSDLSAFVAGADLLLVVGLAPHFFLTVGPTVSLEWAGDVGSTLGVGANVGLGVAL